MTLNLEAKMFRERATPTPSGPSGLQGAPGWIQNAVELQTRRLLVLPPQQVIKATGGPEARGRTSQ